MTGAGKLVMAAISWGELYSGVQYSFNRCPARNHICMKLGNTNKLQRGTTCLVISAGGWVADGKSAVVALFAA